MASKHFKNQDTEKVISHLKHFLKKDVKYNLKIDPLGIHFEINETLKKSQRTTNRDKFSGELSSMSKKQRRNFNLKRRRLRSKIRSVKKGRTVSLKGQTNY